MVDIFMCCSIATIDWVRNLMARKVMILYAMCVQCTEETVNRSAIQPEPVLLHKTKQSKTQNLSTSQFCSMLKSSSEDKLNGFLFARFAWHCSIEHWISDIKSIKQPTHIRVQWSMDAEAVNGNGAKQNAGLLQLMVSKLVLYRNECQWH